MAFIPLMSDYLTKQGRAAAWELFSRVANLAFVVTGSMAIIIAIFAEPIVNAELGIAPGFGAEQRQLARGTHAVEFDRHDHLFDQRSGDGKSASQPAFYSARLGADHVQRRSDFWRDLSRAALWHLWSRLWRDSGRCLAPTRFKFRRCSSMNSNGLPPWICTIPA